MEALSTLKFNPRIFCSICICMSMLFFVPRFAVCETKNGLLAYRSFLNMYLEMLKCWLNYSRREDFAKYILCGIQWELCKHTFKQSVLLWIAMYEKMEKFAEETGAKNYICPSNLICWNMFIIDCWIASTIRNMHCENAISLKGPVCGH